MCHFQNVGMYKKIFFIKYIDLSQYDTILINMMTCQQIAAPHYPTHQQDIEPEAFIFIMSLVKNFTQFTPLG